MSPLSPELEKEIAAAKALRAELRSALSTGAFDTLDARLGELALQSLGRSDTLYRWACSTESLFEPNHVAPLPVRMALVDAWRRARPTSYHAHWVTAALWTDIALLGVRENYPGLSGVETLAPRALALDNAWVKLWQAMQLEPQPLLACELAMTLTVEFYEPAWVRALVDDEPVVGVEQALQEQLDLLNGPEWVGDFLPTLEFNQRPRPPEVAGELQTPWQPASRFDFSAVQATLTQLSGVTDVIPTLPTGLPPCLLALGEDRRVDPAWGYQRWLRCCLAMAPTCLPTWVLAMGGVPMSGVEDDDSEEFAEEEGPTWLSCQDAFIEEARRAGLSESDIGALRFRQEFPLLEEFADEEAPEDVAAQTTSWKCLLDHPMLPLDRFNTLLHYGEFLSHLGRKKEAGKCHQQAVALYRDAQVIWYPKELQMMNRVLDLIMGESSDPQGVVALELAVAEAWGDSLWHMLLVIAARQWGLFGVTARPTTAQIPLVLNMVATDDATNDTVTDVLELLWGPDYVQARLWLAELLAENNNAAAQDFLADMYGDPVDYDLAPVAKPKHAKLALHWLERAMSNNLSRAKVKWVKNHLLHGVYEVSDRALLEEATTLLLQAWDDDDPDAAFELFNLLFDSGTPKEIAWAHEYLTPELLESDDSAVLALVSARLANLYLKRDSHYYQPRLAYAWARYGVSIDSEGVNSALFEYVIQETMLTAKLGNLRRSVLSRFADSDLKVALETGMLFAPEGFEP